MKINLNSVFTVTKNGKQVKWKVIEHPYFPGALTLVRDYYGMCNDYKKEDDCHLCGHVTLDDAYAIAFSMS